MTAKKYILARVYKTSDCWLWLHSLDGTGHPKAKYGGKTVGVTRLAYQAWHGALAPQVHVYTTCVNKLCVNPSHLTLERPTLINGRLASSRPRTQPRTHCVNGHEYTPENLITKGKDHCRQCNKDRCRRYRARMKANK